MKVVSLAGPGKVEIIEKPEPTIARDYVLIKVVVAPMCNEHLAFEHWDFRDRNRPDSLGHEVAGDVVESFPGSTFRPGDRVVALSGYPCGSCAMCRSGAYAHCPVPENPLAVCGSVSGECGFAEYMIKPEWLLLRIPEDVPYEHASMACCGLGATFTAMETMKIGSGDTVLVTGLGPVGLGAVINGLDREARVVAAGSTPYRLDLAARLGADTVNLNGGNANDIRCLTDGVGPDHVIVCAAVSRYQRLALDVVRRGGGVTFLGESGTLPIHVDRDLIQKGVTLRGSLDLYLPHADSMLALIRRNGPLIDTFITHEFPMSDIAKAWELQVKKSCGKTIIRS
ncbi:MAG: zinc-dependent alcohol dehydrogenase [Pseudonocardiales bacterium]